MLKIIFLFFTLLPYQVFACGKNLNLDQINKQLQYKSSQPEKLKQTYWIEPKTEVRGVMLAVHGLNNNSKSLVELLSNFTDSGIKVLNVVLMGQRGDFAEAESVQMEDIDFMMGKYLCLARAEATRENVPFYLLGYSMGSAILSHMLQQNQFQRLDVEHFYQVAPAIELQGKALYTRYAEFLPSNWVLKSQMPQEFRANEYIPMSLYSLTWKFYQNVSQVGLESLLKLNSTIIIDPQDELIDFSKLKNWIQKTKSWKLFTLNSLPRPKINKNHHFIIHQSGVGPSEWIRLKDFIKNTILN